MTALGAVPLQLGLLDESDRRRVVADGHTARVERAKRHALSGMRLPPGEASDVWRTPPRLIRAVRLATGGIDIDAACDSHNVVSDPIGGLVAHRPGLRHDEGSDALTESWAGAIDPWLDDASWWRHRRPRLGVSGPHRWVAWCNPPYGDLLPRFVDRAYAIRQAEPVEPILLCPPRVGTAWWYEHVIQTGANVVFLAGGRLAFLNVLGQPIKDNSADSCLIHWVDTGRAPFRSWAPIAALEDLERAGDVAALRRMLIEGQ